MKIDVDQCNKHRSPESGPAHTWILDEGVRIINLERSLLNKYCSKSDIHMREEEMISDTTCEKYLKMHPKSWQCKPSRKQRKKIMTP